MRKLVLILTVALFSMASLPATAADLKIGVVNTPKLISESPQATALREKLKQEFAPRVRELQAQQSEIQSLQEKYKRDAAAMSESERASMENRLRDLGRDFQFKQQSLQDDQRRRYNEEMGKLQGELLQAIQEFAKAEGFDLVFTEGVAYRSEVLDITDKVLARINKK